MAYTTDKKSTGLDVLTDITITQSDLHIVGDVSDSGRAKAITQNHLEDYIANSTNFIDELIGNTYFTTEISGNIEVVTDGTTIIGDGTTGNPLVATAGAGAGIVKARSTDTTPGYLDDKISIISTDGSVTVTKTINNPSGNEDIEYDLSANITAQNITTIEDFLNGYTIGTVRYWGSNWLASTSNNPDQTDSETNHNGVILMNGSSSAIYGFTNTTSPSAGNPQGLCMDNDIDMTFYSKIVYTGSLTDTIAWGLNGDARVFASISFSSGTGTVNYGITGTPVSTGATVPATNTWFKVQITKSGSTVTIKLDGQTLYTGTPSFTPNSQVWGEVTKNSGTLDVYIDAISTNYGLTR